MKKRVRLVAFVVFLFVLILAFTSCKKNSNNNGTANNGNLNIETDIAIVLGEGVDEQDVYDLVNNYYYTTGKTLPVKTSDAESSKREIIIGTTERSISKKAYLMLERTDTQGTNDTGFVIYSDSNSIAIAFDYDDFGTNLSKKDAISYFASNYMQTELPEFESGVIYSERYDLVERQKEIDDQDIEKIWQTKKYQLASKVGGNTALAEEIITALQGYYELFTKDDGIVSWIANLYCPENGGFYYSNSARDNEGYLPDIESTTQALGIIEELLVHNYDGTLKEFLGDEVSNSIVKFVKDMQDPVNGYFYHPQWPRALSDQKPHRIGRDVDSAIRILKRFGASPTYDTPNGYKGDGLLSDGTPVAASVLTKPISDNGVAAVAAVILANDVDAGVPYYLKDRASFEAYLATFDLNATPYSTGNHFEAMASQIAQRDKVLASRGANYSLAKILTDWFTAHQDPNTGLWTLEGPYGYNAINGLLKIGSLYGRLGYVIPNASKAFGFAVDVMLSEDDPGMICDIFNTWYAMAVIYQNLTKYGTVAEAAEVERLRRNLISSLPEMINVTTRKVAIFIKTDGSVSYTPTHSSETSQGMPVAVPYTNEGDVNATMIASLSIPSYLFQLTGIASVPMYTTSDRIRFQSIMMDLGYIIKHESKEPEKISFEDEDIGQPSSYVSTSFNSSGSALVQKLDNGNKVLQFISKADGASKGSDEIDIPTPSRWYGAACNIFEFDMCIMPETAEGKIFSNIRLYKNMYMLSIGRYGDTIRIFEDSSWTGTNSFKHDLGVEAKVGEWFNIRIEYYSGDSETVRIKVYFNGDCVVVSDNFFDPNADKLDGPGNPLIDYSMGVILMYSNAEANVLIDNIIAGHSTKSYTPESNPEDQPNRNVDAPDVEQIVHTFEDEAEGALPEGFVLQNGAAGVVLKDNVKFLSIRSEGTKLSLPLHSRGSGANTGILSFNATVPENSEVGAKYAFNFKEYKNQGVSLIAFHMQVIEIDGVKYATFHEVSSGKTANEMVVSRVRLGEEFNVRIEFFFEESSALVFVNDELVGVSGNVAAGQLRYYFGEIEIENITGDKESELLVDDLICERVNGNYEKSSAPKIDRVTHIFESLNGYDYKGLASNGEYLVAKSNYGYINIPVNNRTAFYTCALLGMNISTGAKDGNVTVSFKDSKGQIIASFAIVSSNTNTLVYEVTANGRYREPICTIRSTAFKLSIEYSPKYETFNILVNNDCVAVSSVTYSEGSDDYKFEYAEIDFYGTYFGVANVIAETSASLFKLYTLSTKNPDDSNQIMTYESSSIANIPSRITKGFVSAGVMLRVREDTVSNKVTRVLAFTTTPGGTDYIKFDLTKKKANSNAVSFETDIKINTEKSFTFAIEPMAGSIAYRVIVSVTPDGTMRFSSSDFNVAAGNEDEWIHIRLEYSKTSSDYTGDGINDLLVRLYINGSDEPVAEGYTPYGDEMFEAAEVSEVRIFTWTNAEGDILFDNTLYEQFSMNHPAPPEFIPEDTDVLTYEKGVIPSGVRQSLSSPNATLKISEYTVSGEVSKALNFTTSAGSTDNITFALTLRSETFNAIAFETDIKIQTAGSLKFAIEPKSTADIAYRVIVNTTSDGATQIVASDFAAVDASVEDNWFRLRVEYANMNGDFTGDGVNDILVRVYVNGVKLAEGHTPYTENYCNPADISQIRIFTWTAAEGSIFFDNTKFEQFTMTNLPELVPDNEDNEEPTIPESPDIPTEPTDPTDRGEGNPFEEIPGSGTSGGGWT